MPLYNIYILVTQLLKRELCWRILYLIPFVNLVVFVIDCIEVAKRFSKDALWGVGLALLGFVIAPILGFSEEHRWRNA